uniref:N-acetyltransferase n=1 Tax=Thermorudis peleae TaxID=1382356 RepID=A0A831TH77_9BACT
MTGEIRAERPVERAAIRTVHLEAFYPSPNEAYLVELLRRAGRMTFSLVAVHEGLVVGHVAFLPVTIHPTPAERIQGLALGPIGVLPAYQRKGTGSRLVCEGLEACRASGYGFVVLLGDPRYYRRFGFVPASTYRLGNDYGAGDAFMALELQPGILREVEGLVRYPREFDQVGC